VLLLSSSASASASSSSSRLRLKAPPPSSSRCEKTESPSDHGNKKVRFLFVVVVHAFPVEYSSQARRRQRAEGWAGGKWRSGIVSGDPLRARAFANTGALLWPLDEGRAGETGEREMREHERYGRFNANKRQQLRRGQQPTYLSTAMQCRLVF
jgi:hypothetical protein